MDTFNTRRNFLKTAVFSGCAWPAFRLLGQTDDGCEERLKQLRVRYQRGFAEERAVLFKKLVSQYGSGILDIVREQTIQDAKQSLQEADLPKRVLGTVMEILWKPLVGLVEYRVEQQTPEFLKMHITRCLFADAMRKHDAAEIGFAFYCAYDYGFCEGLNPNIQFTRTQTLMESHPFCNHTYVLKQS